MRPLALMQLDRFRDHGLLALRVGMGLMFVGHGWPKLAGGPEKWAKIGGAMSNLGIDFAPAFWGFMAGFAECGGGILLVLGLLTRPAAALLVCTMVVAAIRHVAAGDGFGGWSHATEAGITFASLFLMGPGKFSLDFKLFGGKRED
jgi:putative oxidoreductase